MNVNETSLMEENPIAYLVSGIITLVIVSLVYRVYRAPSPSPSPPSTHYIHYLDRMTRRVKIEHMIKVLKQHGVCIQGRVITQNNYRWLKLNYYARLYRTGPNMPLTLTFDK